MSVFRSVGRRQVFIAALVLTVGMVETTAAEPQAKKPVRLVEAGAAVARAKTPHFSISRPRFFTIKGVLAKHAAGLNKLHGIHLASTRSDDTANDAPPAGARSVKKSLEPFGLFSFRAPEGLLWVKWRGIQAAMSKETDELAACRAEAKRCSRATSRFADLIDAVRAQQGRARIAAVNRAVNNAVRYTSDFTQHGVPDRWSAPLATFASGRGDCEDYAIAKYVALRQAGVAKEALRLLLVRDQHVRQDHAVLAVRERGAWHILDNRTSRLLETADLPHFTPLFAIDHHGVSLFAAPYVSRRLPADESTVMPAAHDQHLIAGEALSSSSLSTAPLLL